MALSVSVLSPCGLSATYWRIVKATYDRTEDAVHVDLYGYVDAAHAAVAPVPLDCRPRIVIACATLGLTPGGSLALAPLYGAVKAAADAAPADTPIGTLAGAEDC